MDSPAPLNMMKLCVGADSPDHLAAWQKQRFGTAPACHVTRMWPKRDSEIRDGGGSIYWVFKGMMLARQKLIGFEERIGQDGIRRCALMLDRDLVRVAPVPRRAFQGWRYLEGGNAPTDLPRGAQSEPSLPPEVAARLADMGLL
ncbi:DUF1489 family protein [Paracoccus tegillarcae]|uniref:DUF1489 domain-containing protein n=1 Tax=Paracoccus tegillarcae TaxID=1529068 RepID=A0A2K9EIS7_9RHOB|nr:DUF1489 domain-containing protein [Paracoccus tegillarcae]AUH34908.1 DUF1489 domain-containing protein [Paracoccus tegillarcae]